MFPARREAADTKEEEEQQTGGSGGAELRRRDCRGWRFLLSLIVGRDLASSSSLGLFFMVMAGDFLATMSLYIPYTHLPDMAMARGVDPRDAAFLISSAGICSTVGRVVAGAVCDQGSLHPLTLTLTATALAASQSFLLALCSQYWQFLLLTSGFGLATGFWVACETPLIIRTLSFTCLTPAFGLLTAGGGLAALTGAPLAGSVLYHYHYHIIIIIIIIIMINPRYAMDLSSKQSGMAVVLCGCIMGSSALVYGLATLVRCRQGNSRREGYQQI